jgi:glycosyltransferase domain-containing protein
MRDKVTVGLFTYQRPNYLKRQLSFFRYLKYDFRIIILDGSEATIFKEQNKAIAISEKVEYYDIVDVTERHLLFLKLLDTEFAAWCADDDLIVPTYYNKAANFLKENRQYSVVTGQLYTFHDWHQFGGKGYFLRNFLGNHYDIHLGDFAEKIIRKDQAYGMGCPPTYYGLRRSDNVKLFCKHIKDIKLYSSMERLENICNLLLGGIRVIDTLMGFRDYSSEPTREARRDDPKVYISQDDTETLAKIISTELSRNFSGEMLKYYESYAWPLPLRPDQTGGKGAGYSKKARIESLLNLNFAHYFHDFDSDVTQALKNAVTNFK